METENTYDILRKIYIPPEKRQQIINGLKLKLM